MLVSHAGGLAYLPLSQGFVLRLRGLPYTASAVDILNFFSDVPIVRGVEGVVFTYTADGRYGSPAHVLSHRGFGGMTSCLLGGGVPCFGSCCPTWGGKSLDALSAES